MMACSLFLKLGSLFGLDFISASAFALSSACRQITD
jgi:hypothetical protein